jgi:hypothetical protein
VLSFAQWPSVNCLNNYADDLLAEPLTIQGGFLKVPDGPGLGVTVNEAALERLRMAPPYEHPQPRLLMSVIWPGGRVMHYAQMRPQCWQDFLHGNQPAQERGVTMELHPDDGSPAWAELYARAQHGPLRDQR